MSVADVMTVRVVQAAPDESAREAIRKMLAANVGSIAICDGPRLVGIFTERDVLRLAGEAHRSRRDARPRRDDGGPGHDPGRGRRRWPPRA